MTNTIVNPAELGLLVFTELYAIQIPAQVRILKMLKNILNMENPEKISYTRSSERIQNRKCQKQISANHSQTVSSALYSN